MTAKLKTNCKTYRRLWIFIVLFAAFGCSGKPVITNIADAEAKGDEAVVEADADGDADSAESADEQTVEELTNGDESVTEELEPEADAAEETADGEEAASEEEISGELDEIEHAEPFSIKIQKLPWDGVQVAPCGENADSVKQSRAVWGNKSGKVYFGGPEFWVLTESGDGGTLVCDPRVTGAFSIDGRVAEGSTELWAGLTGRIARYSGDSWSFFDIPAEVATGEVIDIDIAGGFISVLTTDSLALYNVANDSWSKVTGCPDDLNRMYGLVYDGQTLWASAGMKMYEISVINSNCQQSNISIEKAGANDSVGVLNGAQKTLWLVLNSLNATDYKGKAKAIASYSDSKIISNDIEPLKSCFDKVEDGAAYAITSVATSGSGEMPALTFTICGFVKFNEMCSFPSTYLQIIYMEIQASGDNKTLLGLSEVIGLAYGCGQSVDVEYLIAQYAKFVQKAKSWRDGNVLWHLYGGPTKYSY